MVEQLGAGSRVQVLQLLHGDLGLHVHDAQDERRVLNLAEEEAAFMLHININVFQTMLQDVEMRDEREGN